MILESELEYVVGGMSEWGSERVSLGGGGGGGGGGGVWGGGGGMEYSMGAACKDFGGLGVGWMGYHVGGKAGGERSKERGKGRGIWLGFEARRGFGCGGKGRGEERRGGKKEGRRGDEWRG